MRIRSTRSVGTLVPEHTALCPALSRWPVSHLSLISTTPLFIFMNRCPHLQRLRNILLQERRRMCGVLPGGQCSTHEFCRDRRSCRGSRREAALVKFLLWFKTTNTWPGRQPCPLQNNGCTCRGLLDARSKAVVLCLQLPTTQNVVCVNEVLLPFPWCSGTCCSVP